MLMFWQHLWTLNKLEGFHNEWPGFLTVLIWSWTPEPRVARNPLKDLSFWVLDYADYLDPLVTEAKKRIPHQWPVHWKVPFVWIWPGLWRWRCLRCPCWYKFVCHQIKFRSGQWGHLCLKGLFSRTTNGTLDANFKSEDHFFVILVALVCKKIRLFNNTRWLGQPQRELRDLFWKKQRQFDRNKVKSGNTSLSNMPSWYTSFIS